MVHHGYLGVGLNDVTPDNAKFFNLTGNTGALIASVTPDSPASRAGLKEGDVVTAVNGHPVETGSDLQVIVSEDAPGTKIQLDVMRNGHPEKIDLTVGEYHKTRKSRQQPRTSLVTPGWASRSPISLRMCGSSCTWAQMYKASRLPRYSRAAQRKMQA